MLQIENKDSNDFTIIIGHPDMLLREGLACILKEAGFKVVGRAANWKTLYDISVELEPDIILLDVGLEGYSPEAIKEINNKTIGTVAVLAPPDTHEEAALALKAGAKGYLTVNQTPQEFVRSLRVIARGDIIVSREAADSLKESVMVSKPMDGLAGLTDRESEVLSFLSNGLTNREISEKLFVSEHTVKVHLRNVLTKLNLRNRQQAAAFAAEHGIIRKIDSGDDTLATS